MDVLGSLALQGGLSIEIVRPQMLFLRSFSEELNGLSFNKTLLGIWRVTRSKMRVLDGFSRFVVCLDIISTLFFELFSLYNVVSREVFSFSANFLVR